MSSNCPYFWRKNKKSINMFVLWETRAEGFLQGNTMMRFTCQLLTGEASSHYDQNCTPRTVLLNKGKSCQSAQHQTGCYQWMGQHLWFPRSAEKKTVIHMSQQRDTLRGCSTSQSCHLQHIKPYVDCKKEPLPTPVLFEGQICDSKAAALSLDVPVMLSTPKACISGAT